MYYVIVQEWNLNTTHKLSCNYNFCYVVKWPEGDHILVEKFCCVILYDNTINIFVGG